MIRIGKVLLGKSPTVVVTLTDTESLRSVQSAKRQGVQILEARIDRFRRTDSDSVLKRIRALRKIGPPLIATIRSRKEGGGRNFSDSERLHLFKKVLPWVNAIDLELSSHRLVQALVPLARRKKKCVILSYHNFRSTPPNSALSRLIQRGRRGGAHLVKIAVTPKRKEDVARFLLFTRRHRDKNLISIAMGRHGTPSRVWAPFFGSLLTYSFLNRSQAPGQIPLRRLSKELDAFEEQTPIEDLRKYLRK